MLGNFKNLTDKKKILKASKEGEKSVNDLRIRLAANVSTAMLNATKMWNSYFKGLCGNYLGHRHSSLGKLHGWVKNEAISSHGKPPKPCPFLKKAPVGDSDGSPKEAVGPRKPQSWPGRPLEGTQHHRRCWVRGITSNGAWSPSLQGETWRAPFQETEMRGNLEDLSNVVKTYFSSLQ